MYNLTQLKKFPTPQRTGVRRYADPKGYTLAAPFGTLETMFEDRFGSTDLLAVGSKSPTPGERRVLWRPCRA